MNDRASMMVSEKIMKIPSLAAKHDAQTGTTDGTALEQELTHIDEESPQPHFSPCELERLGRERPGTFSSTWVEVGFCFSLLGSMFVAEYFVSGFNVLLPTLSKALHIPSQAETWPASVFSLVTGAFLLPFGRLADMFGGHLVFVTGLIWFLIWSIIAGFSQNYIMLIFCRALQGFGPAAFLPSGIMLLGSTVRHARYLHKT
jgi:hypothetical protein